MVLLQEDFDADYCIENVDGIEFGDILYLNYYGINVFFYVCGVDHHQVRLFELAKKRLKMNGESIEVLAPGLKPTTVPKIVLENNCWTKSEYWARTTSDQKVEIPIWDGPLIYNAIKLGIENPVPGYAYAILIDKEERKDIFKYYWSAPKKAKKQKRNIFKISA